MPGSADSAVSSGVGPPVWLPEHRIDPELRWCSRCGRPMTELVEEGLKKCDGLSTVVHRRYLVAKRNFDLVFKPIFAAVIDEYI